MKFKIRLLYFLLASSSGIIGMDGNLLARGYKRTGDEALENAAQALALLSAASSEQRMPDQTNTSPTITPHAPESDSKRKKRAEAHLSCPACPYKCKPASQLQNHILSQHTAYRPYRCYAGNCSYKTSREDYLIGHIRMQHRIEPIQSLYLTDPKDAARHINQYLAKMGWTSACPECDLLFPRASSTLLHMKKHMNAKEAEARILATPAAAQQAQKQDQGEPKTPAPILTPQTSMPPAIGTDKSVETTPESVLYRCPGLNCDFRHNVAQKLKDHILKEHVAYKPYTCLEPGCRYKPTNLINQFNTHMRYARHSNIHAPVSQQTAKELTRQLNVLVQKLGWKHQCTVCEELFPTKISLQNHSNNGHKDTRGV